MADALAKISRARHALPWSVRLPRQVAFDNDKLDEKLWKERELRVARIGHLARIGITGADNHVDASRFV